MKSVHIVEALGVATSATYDASATPFHAGNEVVMMFSASKAGTAGGRGWTAQGNNEPEGATPDWVDLAPEYDDETFDMHTITMPRQLRITNTTAGSGTKTASLHLLGES